MNLKSLLTILLVATALAGCFIFHKKVKVTCNIPANYPEARRKELTDMFYKGEEIYKENCASCHGIFTEGKDSVPNFSTTQLDAYSARFLMRDRQNHAVAMNMGMQQMEEVMTFLRYKKIAGQDSIPMQRLPDRKMDHRR